MPRLVVNVAAALAICVLAVPTAAYSTTESAVCFHHQENPVRAQGEQFPAQEGQFDAVARDNHAARSSELIPLLSVPPLFDCLLLE